MITNVNDNINIYFSPPVTFLVLSRLRQQDRSVWDFLVVSVLVGLCCPISLSFPNFLKLSSLPFWSDTKQSLSACSVIDLSLIYWAGNWDIKNRCCRVIFFYLNTIIVTYGWVYNKLNWPQLKNLPGYRTGQQNKTKLYATDAFNWYFIFFWSKLENSQQEIPHSGLTCSQAWGGISWLVFSPFGGRQASEGLWCSLTPELHCCILPSHITPGLICALNKIWQKWWRFTSDIRL